MPIAETVAAVSSVKTAITIIKGIKQTFDDVKLKEQISPLLDTIIDLQSHILSINTEYQTILDDRDRIRQEIVNLKNWENEKEKYKLFEPGGGVFVYVPKDAQKPGEPEYHLCANCFQNENRKSMLQRKGMAGFEVFKHYCPFCKNEYQYNLNKE
jgi:hypothetical protein